MTAVAACLLAACASACFVIVVLISGLYDISAKRNEAEDRADRLEEEAAALQDELNAALGRLSRKKKPMLTLVDGKQIVQSIELYNRQRGIR